MHAILLTFLLVGGVPLMAAAADHEITTADDEGPYAGAAGGCGSGHAHHTYAYNVWRSAWGWVIPVSHTGYAPGTLRDPLYSWYKHPYLAFRGNYYTHGFDYRWQFDYPWHKTHCSSRGYGTPCARASEGVPVPSAAPGATARATRNAAKTTVR